MAEFVSSIKHYPVVKCPRCATEYNPAGREICPGNIARDPVTNKGIPCGIDVPKYTTVGEPVPEADGASEPPYDPPEVVVEDELDEPDDEE